MNIKYFFLMLRNSSTKMSNEYEKNNSNEIKKLLLKTAISKVRNVYKNCGWNVKVKDKEKIDKNINILDNLLSQEFVKSKLNKNSIASSVELKSHHFFDSRALHYNSSGCQLGKDDIDSIVFNGVDRNNFIATSVNVDFSNSTLSGAKIEFEGNKALVRADFSNATLKDVEIKLPIKLDVNYDFTGAKLNNTKIKLDVPSGGLSEINLVSLFGDDNNYRDGSVFKSILTIDDKNIKSKLLGKLKEAYDSNPNYFEKNRNVEADFLKQYNHFK